MKTYLTFFYFILIVSIILFSATISFEQNSLRLNLAKHNPGEVILLQGNKKFDLVILENTVAHFTYQIDIKKTFTLLPTLVINNNKIASSPGEPTDTSCNSLRDKINDLENFQNKRDEKIEYSEKALNKIVNELNTEIKKSKCKGLKDTASIWRNTTIRIHDEAISIGYDEKITITVMRDTLKWTFVYEGEKRGEWLTNYGFGFTPKNFSRPFFAQQIQDSVKYMITRSKVKNKLDLNYTPAIFFSFLPSQNAAKAWYFGFTGGLGFDFTSPVVFLGGNFMYHQNIGFGFGLAFQQQYTLKDQYKEGEVITSPLDREQLHDKVYFPNFFFSANFRLGKNPFQPVNSKTEDN
jgi:hypothetical protein